MRQLIFNNKLSIICLGLMLFLLSPSFAQSTYSEYKGKVVDARNNKALEYVSLNVLETNISTVTNSEGEFILKVPEVYKNSKVVVALLGYSKKVLNLSDLSDSISIIRMEEVVTELSEVSVSAFKDADRLVRKVFAEKSKTIQNQSVYMTAFYRETIKRRNRNVSLTEAVVNILKQPYTSKNKDAVKLGKARKSTDYKRLDTVSVKLQGGPFSTLYLDIMKYPEYIFTEETLDTYKFSFDPASTVNNRNVYVVDFKPRNKTLDLSYYGKLYIDVETLALVSANYSLDVSNKGKSRNLLVKRKPRDVVVYPLEANYKVDYKQQGAKWYYSYSNLSLKFKVNKKREIFNKVYTLSSEMAVTDWEINTDDIKFKGKDRLRPTVIITDAISGFSDPDFWGEYNLIEPDKSIESAIEKIRKNIKKAQERKENSLP